jgi:hypothetical protein
MTIRKIKGPVKKNRVLISLLKPMRQIFNKKGFDSKSYWEKRYESNGDSGAGSYGKLAKYKAKIVNNFVKKNKINLAVDFGCGDGNQLSFFKIPKYIGLDISKKSIKLCKKRFKNDKSKSFFLYDFNGKPNDFNIPKGNLSLSLDVIFHLVENDVFEKYMRDLFSSSKRYVLIYSSNTDIQKKFQPKHIYHRCFSKWVEKNEKQWKLIKKIKNKYSEEKNSQEYSFSDFYIYKKEGK